MEEKHRLKSAAVSLEMSAHYDKIFESLFNECINKLPEELDVICMAFGVDKTRLTMESCRKVLAKYEKATQEIPDGSQMNMFDKEKL